MLGRCPLPGEAALRSGGLPCHASTSRRASVARRWSSCSCSRRRGRLPRSRCQPAATCRPRWTLAQPGDTIVLEPGATYVGNFRLPAKDGNSYIVLRTGGDARRPAAARDADVARARAVAGKAEVAQRVRRAVGRRGSASLARRVARVPGATSTAPVTSSRSAADRRPQRRCRTA